MIILEHLKFKNYSTKIFLKKFTVIAERFSLSDFNRQIIIDFSTNGAIFLDCVSFKMNI